jgi:Methyltransferase domain
MPVSSPQLEQRLAELDLALFGDVPSQSTDNDKRSLLACQLAVRSLRPGYRYLEIGSYLGGSIQPHLIDPECSRMFSIDKRPASQPDSRGLRWKYPSNTTERMIDALRDAGSEAFLQKLTCIEGEVREINRGRIEGPIDLCFVDGEHTDEALVADFEFCLDILEDGGAIVCHDSQIVYMGLSYELERMRSEGIAFHAYNLPDTLLVVEVGDFPLHRHDAISRLLLDNHVGYLASLRMNDEFREFANRPVLRHLRAMRAALSRENVSD